MSVDMQWYVWVDGCRPPAENMAVDDVILQQVPKWGAILRFYEWDCPAISIGYFQPLRAAGKPDCIVVRRPSGGGVVDHRRDFTFSLVMAAKHPLYSVNRFESYRLVNETVCRALANHAEGLHLHDHKTPKSVDRRHLICFDTPARYDVVGPKGKLCGGAQRRRSEGMLHQGSIRLDRLPKISRSELRKRLIDSFIQLLPGPSRAFHPSAELDKKIHTLCEEKYGNCDWVAKR